jgi:plasmid maintenance system killer protein
MIRSFADKVTERLFRDGTCPARWRIIETIALRKLDMVDAATRVDDLRSPPGNRLEALKAIAADNTLFGSTGSGAFASDGHPTVRKQ